MHSRTLLVLALLTFLLCRASLAEACDPDAYEPDDLCPTTAYGLQGGATQSRNFCDDPQDLTAFGVCAGRSYTVETGNLGVATDTILDLLDGDCSTVLATDDDGAGGLASPIVWTAVTDGLLHVRVRSKGGASGDDQEYELHLSGDTSPCSTWATILGTTAAEGANSVLVLSNGDFLVTGTVGGDLGVARLDPAGFVVWSNRLTSPPGTASLQSAIQSGEEILLAGSTSSFGAGGSDAWVVRLDGSGNVVWQKAYGTTAADGAIALLAAPGGGFYLVGNTGSSGWVARLDDGGAIVWEKSYDTLTVTDAILTLQGELALAGTRRDLACPFCDTGNNFTILWLDADGVPISQYLQHGCDEVVRGQNRPDRAGGGWLVVRDHLCLRRLRE